MPPALRSITAVRLFFFLQPIAFGAWLPRIPEVQEKLGLDAAGLAFALIGMPAGILATLPFAGRQVDKHGARRTLLLLLPLFLLLTTAPVVASTPVLLFLGLACLGCTMATIELAMNVEAGNIEKNSGKNIMSACHGLWSLGMMAGSLASSGLAALGWSPGLSVAVLAALLLVPGWLAAAAFEPDEPVSQPDENAQHFIKPTRKLVAIASFVFAITLTEGAMADWSAIYMKQVMNLPTEWVGAGYVCFAAAITGMRFLGDGLIARFGAMRLALISMTVAMAGVAVLCLAPLPAIAALGFILVGAGVATGFPMAVTAAGLERQRPVAASVAFISFVALVGFLVGPVIIGWTTSTFGMRTALALLIPLLAVSLFNAGALRNSAASKA